MSVTCQLQLIRVSTQSNRTYNPILNIYSSPLLSREEGPHVDESVQLSENALSSIQLLAMSPPLSYCNPICATTKETHLNQILF